MARTEVEAVALATAEDGLDWAGTLPFDEQTGATTPALLTAAGDFGTAAGTFDAATDLDDLDGAARTGDVAMAGGTVSLQVQAAVRYVTLGPSGPAASPVQTAIKEVTLVVTGPVGAEVTVSRLYPFRSGL